MKREIRDSEGKIVKRPGVVITVAYKVDTTAGLLPGDQIYMNDILDVNGVLAYTKKD